jgi:hypothetical protein
MRELMGRSALSKSRAIQPECYHSSSHTAGYSDFWTCEPKSFLYDVEPTTIGKGSSARTLVHAENVQPGVPAKVSATRSGGHRIVSGAFLCHSANCSDPCA